MTTDYEFWDGIADKYAATPVKDRSAFERKQAITREHLRADSSVLELGSGTGSLALAMSPAAGHIHALDVSPQMIRIANRKKQEAGVTNVTFHQGTLEGATAFRPEQFDCVWAYSFLHLIEDRPRTLRAVFDLLKPGGVFISSNVSLGDSWIPYGALIAVARWLGKAPRVHIYDRATITRELSEAGFTQVTECEVGAAKTIAFIVAKKPALERSA